MVIASKLDIETEAPWCSWDVGEVSHVFILVFIVRNSFRKLHGLKCSIPRFQGRVLVFVAFADNHTRLINILWRCATMCFVNTHRQICQFSFCVLRFCCALYLLSSGIHKHDHCRVLV